MNITDKPVTRQSFMKSIAVGGAALAAGSALAPALGTLASVGGPRRGASKVKGEWRATTCQGCTSWCAVQVYVEDGRAVKIRGNPHSKVNNGHCCPRAHLALQQVYDPDRLVTPLKRTNPKKGVGEDPGFVPVSWEEATGMIADRIMELRRNNEAHKYMLMRGRYSYMRDIVYDRMTKIVGSPNNISHSAICAEAEKIGPYYTEGLWDYRQYDVTNSNYVLLWGADPLAANRQVSYYSSVWGKVMERATIAVVDPRLSVAAAKADEWLPIKPGEDGALAVALAHIILTEGRWSREFAGDFHPQSPIRAFVSGKAVPEEFSMVSPDGSTVKSPTFTEKHTHGLLRWWNIELKDKTADWAAGRTGLSVEQIRRVAIGLGKAAPRSIVWVGGGPAMQVRGSYTSMAAHALNGLLGSVDNEGGTLTANKEYTRSFPGVETFLDDTAKAGMAHKKIDRRGSKDFPCIKDGKPGDAVVTNRAADGILDADPYDIKVAIGYFNNFAFSCPQNERWHRALAKIPFVAHLTTHISEFTWFADIVLPCSHHLFEKWGYLKSMGNGYRQVTMNQRIIEPVWDVKADETEIPWLIAEKLAERGFTNLLDHYKQYQDPETGRQPANEGDFALFALKHATRDLWDPAHHQGGDRFDGWDDFLRKGVWNSDPYPYRRRWSAMKTQTGKFEFYSETLKNALTAHADNYATSVDDILASANYLARGEQAFVPHYEAPFLWGDEHQYPFVFVDYKSRLNREGRSTNCYWYHEFKDLDPGDESWADVAKLNPLDGRKLGIEDGDDIRLVSPTGSLTCKAKLWEGVRPGTIAKSYGQGHWVYGRVAAQRFGKSPAGGNNNEIIPADYDRLSGSTAFYGVTRIRVEKA